MPNDIYFDPGYVDDEYDEEVEEVEGVDEVFDDGFEEDDDLSDTAYNKQKGQEEDLDNDNLFDTILPVEKVEDASEQEGDGFLETEKWDDLDPNLQAKYAAEFITPFTDYSPEELVDFSEKEMTHEVTVLLELPRESCFKLWEDRLNWLEWMYMIHRMGIDPDNNDHAAVYAYYQWGRTPPFELYFVLERKECLVNQCIVEESVKGMPFKGRVDFKDGPQAGTTAVTLTITYAIPTVLLDFVGPVGLYGDVNDLLEDCLVECKDWCESQDLEEVFRVRQEDREYYKRGENPPGWDDPDQVPVSQQYYNQLMREQVEYQKRMAGEAAKAS